MDRNDEHNAEVQDLGAASLETQGQPGTKFEGGVIGRPLGIEDDD